MDYNSSVDTGGLAAFFGAYMIFILIILAVTIIAQWKIYVKMGEPGWACLVPFYNTWLLFKHCLGSGAKMFLMLIPFIGGIFGIICTWKLYEGFGKNTLFKILGLFFAPICMLICAFDSSTFMDP